MVFAPAVLSCLAQRHGQPAPSLPCLLTGLSGTGEMLSLHRCSPAALGRRNKRPPSLFRSSGCGMLRCYGGVLAWRELPRGFREQKGIAGTSTGLLEASPCGPSTASLQKTSQLCSKTSQFPAVCLFVPPSKGFSSCKLLLHQVLVRKPLADRTQLPSGCQSGPIRSSWPTSGCSAPAATSQSKQVQ